MVALNLQRKKKIEVTDAQGNSQVLSAPHIILATEFKARHVLNFLSMEHMSEL